MHSTCTCLDCHTAVACRAYSGLVSDEPQSFDLAAIKAKAARFDTEFALDEETLEKLPKSRRDAAHKKLKQLEAIRKASPLHFYNPYKNPKRSEAEEHSGGFGPRGVSSSIAALNQRWVLVKAAVGFTKPENRDVNGGAHFRD